MTISGKLGDDPVALYGELCQVVEDVLSELQAAGRELPKPSTRPMQEVA